MATQAAPLVEQLKEAQTATAAAAPPELLSSVLNDIIAQSEAGSEAYKEAVQMKSDFAQGVMYARGTKESGGKFDPADIALRIRFGREIGLSSIQSARGLFFQKGVPGMMGNVLEVLMYRHGYRWQFVQRDTKGCKLRLVKNGQVVMDGDKPAEASYMEEDAKRAKLDQKDTYKQDPESMYYWRALSRLQKFYVPEATEFMTFVMPGEIPVEEVVNATESRMGEATAAAALREKLAAVTQAPVGEEVAA